MILNAEQQITVDSNEQFIFLIAGAGSGKTRVIVERIKRLISDGVLASEILCITFTNKATDEMKLRLRDYNIYTNTFHGYCYKILKNFKEFKIFEHNNKFSDEEILQVSTYKNSLKKTRKPNIFDTYEAYLKQFNLLDFDDLMIESFKYLSHHTYKYIFIDEFQDTNLLQYKLLNMMIQDDVHVFAVGDPDQSIYAFRGARVELIEKYLRDYNAKLLKLELNYRSNHYILDAANHLISKNINRYKKRLVGVRDYSKEPTIYIGQHEDLCRHIIYLIKLNKTFDAVILFRNHYQVAYLAQLLQRHYLFNVKLYSFHESKGLEFKVVYIVGLEDLPYDKTNIYKNKEEERRLLFVAMTRAMNELTLFSTRNTAFLRQTKIKIKYLKNM